MRNKEFRALIDQWYSGWFAMDGLYGDWARKKGITQTTLFCLYEIDQMQENGTAGEIAVRLGRSRQTVNSALDQMEKRGVIDRRRDTRDGRAKIIAFTDAGRRWAHEILKELDDLETAAFEMMQPQDAEKMVQAEAELAHHIERMFTREEGTK